MPTWTVVLLGIWLWFMVGALTFRVALLFDRLSKKFHDVCYIDEYSKGDLAAFLIFGPVIIFVISVVVFVQFVLKPIVWLSGYKK